MSPRLICHVDMNSYFASVEQQANPLWRDRPLGVCAYLHPHGCLIAASVEAKQMGIKVGMTVSEAKRRVPGMHFVENDPGKYRSVTSRIFSLLHTVSDRIEPYSIDEAFLDMTGWYRDEAEVAFALSRIKQRIRGEIGDWLRCSVGIAPTKFLAKFASDRQKPDGLTVITPETIVPWLSVPVQEACGIGFRLRRRLAQLGVRTLLDLYHYSPTNLMQVFGVHGFFLWCHVRGIECDAFAPPEAVPKSIGHSYCVPRRVSREGGIEAVLTKLTERAGRRMRGYGLLAGRLAIGVHVIDDTRYLHAQRIFPEPSDHVFVLIRTAIELLRELGITQEIDFLSVTLLDVRLPKHQLTMSLADSVHSLHERRLQSVSRSIDRIRDRHGEESIVLGRMWKAMGGRSAPDRIGFRKTDGVAVSEFEAYDERVCYEPDDVS